MAASFSKLDRVSIRQLARGCKITERGMTVEKLAEGDLRYSVNVMVDGQRIHRVLGKESEGLTRSQVESFIAKVRTQARENRLSLPKRRKLSLTFKNAADIYLHKLLETGAKDYVNNEQHLRLHLKPFFGSMRLDKISTHRGKISG